MNKYELELTETGPICIGKQYNSLKEFKMAVETMSVNLCKKYRRDKSNKKFACYKCFEFGCPFEIKANYRTKVNAYEVVSYINHDCAVTSSLPTSKWLQNNVKTITKRFKRGDAAEIISDLKADLGIETNYLKMNRAINSSINSINKIKTNLFII